MHARRSRSGRRCPGRSLEWLDGRYRRCATSDWASEATISALPNAASYAQWWEYDWVTGPIRVPSSIDGWTCLDLQWNNPAEGQPIWMYDCDGYEAQQWNMTASHQIISLPHGKCVELQSDWSIALKTCSSSSAQKWRWDADSRVSGFH